MNHLQIAAAIEEDIRSKKFFHGEKIPNEVTLQVRYNASNSAVRHAKRLLEEKGFIRTTRGVGSFVIYRHWRGK